MGLFSFFKQNKHNNFEFKPRFYDADAEKRKERLKILRAGKDMDKISKNDENYMPGDIIKNGFYVNNNRKKRKKFSYLTIIVLIFIIILAIYLLQSEYYVKFISIFFNN